MGKLASYGKIKSDAPRGEMGKLKTSFENPLGRIGRTSVGGGTRA